MGSIPNSSVVAVTNLRKKTMTEINIESAVPVAEGKTENKRMTKAQIVGSLAEKSGLSKKQVADLFGNLTDLVHSELKGFGEFILPDLIKLKVKNIPAREAQMKKNPLTGQMAEYAAKPASRKVRASVLKSLKDTLS